MEKQHLGIANVPCQTWGELFTPEEALKIGTIFKELNKPFFAANQPANKPKANIPLGQSPKNDQEREREVLMTQINQTSFLLDDLTLYLDTHAEDQNALNLYHEFSQKRDQLKKDFADKYYPLTRDCIASCKADHNGFCWQEGPIPWEGACV